MAILLKNWLVLLIIIQYPCKEIGINDLIKNNVMKTKQETNLKFIDFCAGIGGGRLGLQNIGLNCIAFSEIDKHAEKTYREFFGHQEKIMVI